MVHLVAVLGAIYAVALAVYAALRYTIRDGRWWLVVLNDFAPFFFLPAVPLLLLALLTRRRLLLLSLAPVALFLYLYGGLFLPHASDADTLAGPRLTVLTNNLWIENDAPDWVAGALTDAAPDLVALQELGPAMARELVERVGSRYPYRALHPSPAGDGAGLLSRYPIRREATFSLADSTIICQDLWLEVEGRTLRVLNIRLRHPQYGWRRRNGFPPLRPIASGAGWQTEEVTALLERVELSDEPLVALGDFNLTDQSPEYRRIARRLGDTHRDVGWGFGFTFPDFVSRRGLALSTPPFLRIDYIWHSRELHPIWARVGPADGSDHRPVLARFVLAPAAAWHNQDQGPRTKDQGPRTKDQGKDGWVRPWSLVLGPWSR